VRISRYSGVMRPRTSMPAPYVEVVNAILIQTRAGESLP
jgi:hypothetical protein